MISSGVVISVVPHKPKEVKISGATDRPKFSIAESDDEKKYRIIDGPERIEKCPPLIDVYVRDEIIKQAMRAFDGLNNLNFNINGGFPRLPVGGYHALKKLRTDIQNQAIDPETIEKKFIGELPFYENTDVSAIFGRNCVDRYYFDMERFRKVLEKNPTLIGENSMTGFRAERVYFGLLSLRIFYSSFR